MLVFNLTKLATTMYKSNSGLGVNSNRFLRLFKYIAIRKVRAFKSATALILTVSGQLKTTRKLNN